MLNKFRNSLSKAMNSVATPIARAGISPDLLTYLSLAVMALGLLLLYYGHGPLVFAAFILISGSLDVIDGAVARVSGRATKRGALLDSTIDKLNEFLIALGLLILGFDPLLVLAFLAFSLLVSYTRAKGEALGVQMSGVGIMERAERLIFVIIALLVYEANRDYAHIALTALTLLTFATFIQRTIYLYRELGA